MGVSQDLGIDRGNTTVPQGLGQSSGIGVDYNHPLFLSPSDIALLERNKLGPIDESCRKDKFSESMWNHWERVNAIVLSWLMNSVAKHLLGGVIQVRGQILMKIPLLSINQAYALVVSDKSQKSVISTTAVLSANSTAGMSRALTWQCISGMSATVVLRGPRKHTMYAGSTNVASIISQETDKHMT